MRPNRVARYCSSSCRYVLFSSCTCITCTYIILHCTYRTSEWQVPKLGDLSHWCLLQVRIQPPCIDPLLTLIMYVLFRVFSWKSVVVVVVYCFFLLVKSNLGLPVQFFFHVGVNLCFSTLMQMFIWSSTIQGGNWPLGDGTEGYDVPPWLREKPQQGQNAESFSILS